MTIAALVVGSFLVGMFLAEVLRAFNGLWFRRQVHKIGERLREFRNADGDDARQALLFRSGRLVLQFSLVLLGGLAGLAAIIGLVPWALGWAEKERSIYLGGTSLVATGWWLLRLHKSPTPAPRLSGHPYGVLDRWLHWLALEPTVVRHLAFELERLFALPQRPTSISSLYKTADPADGAVYVCGLARSGTTMLLRILNELDVFRSLTYRDMPFVLAPNLWGQIAHRLSRRSVPTERAHGDGIYVDLDSPEGLEEVFWRTFGATVLEGGCLGTREPSSEVLAAFADYRALVANPRTKPRLADVAPRRYLSKNNNNLLRLRSLCADPTATVLLAFRNPIATARSLHRQHQRFCTAQAMTPFVQTYMGWLAHHEFGLDHHPFCFAAIEMDAALKPDNPDYWLEYWSAVYGYVLTQLDLRVHLIDHDALRANPAGTLDVVFAALGVRADTATLAQQIAPPSFGAECTDGFSPERLRRAEAIYRALLASPRNLSPIPGMRSLPQ